MYDVLHFSNYDYDGSGLISSSEQYPPYSGIGTFAWYFDPANANDIWFGDADADFGVNWGRTGYTSYPGWSGAWSPYNSGYAKPFLFKPRSIVSLSSIALRGDCYNPCILLVAPGGATLGLWSMSSGNVGAISNTHEVITFDGVSKTETTTIWEFPEFAVESFIVGHGGLGYPQELNTFITGLWTDRLFNAPLFWTNFRSQYEV